MAVKKLIKKPSKKTSKKTVKALNKPEPIRTIQVTFAEDLFQKLLKVIYYNRANKISAMEQCTKFIVTSIVEKETSIKLKVVPQETQRG